MKIYSFLLLLFVFTLFSCGNGGETKTKTDSVVKTDSLSIINGMITKDPGNLDLYVRRSKIYMNMKDYNASVADMDRVLKIDSNNANYLLAAADIYFFTNHTLRTDSLLVRAVRLHPENIDCILRLAQLNHYLTNYGEEVKLLDQALKLDVHNAQAYYMKGMMFKEMHDTAKAISSLQTAVEQDPDHYNAYMQLGLLCSAKNDPLAESYFLNALKVNESSEEAAYGLAMYYQQTENWNRAIETYTSLLKVNPHNFDAHFNLGMIHAVKLKVVDEGMKDFARCVEDDPKNPRGYYGLGYCYEVNGDVANAELNYKKALQVDPDYTNAAIALDKLHK
jgi:tetratricopeptide (TPR) repeat protein